MSGRRVGAPRRERSPASPSAVGTSGPDSVGPEADPLVYWACAQVGLGVLRELAVQVRPYGLRLMGIKGIHRYAIEGGRPSGRALHDVDALIVEGDVELLVILLRAGHFRGFHFEGRDEQAIHVRRDGCPLMLDLHFRVMPPFFGDLSTAGLRRRSGHAADRDLSWPSALDGMTIALAHFAKDRLTPRKRRDVASDLRFFSRDLPDGEHRLAEHLRNRRVRRLAAVAILGLEDETVAQRFLAVLAPRAVERRGLAWVARLLRHPAVGNSRSAGFWVVRAIRDTWVDLAASFAFQTAKGLGRRAEWARTGLHVSHLVQRYLRGRREARRRLAGESLSWLQTVADEPVIRPHLRPTPAMVRALVIGESLARRLGMVDTCLQRAAARYLFLRRLGVPIQLVFGLVTAGRIVDGHAWTEFDDGVWPADDQAPKYDETMRFPRLVRGRPTSDEDGRLR